MIWLAMFKGKPTPLPILMMSTDKKLMRSLYRIHSLMESPTMPIP